MGTIVNHTCESFISLAPGRSPSDTNYYKNSFNKYTGASKKTWQTINELTSRKSGKKSVTSLKVNGVSITNPTVLSNQFNNHFATIGPELASKFDSSVK